MNVKRRLFCQEYVIDRNGTQAAVRSGYNPRTANEYAVQLLSDPEVKSYIAQLNESKARELDLDRTWVLQNLKAIVDRCMQAEPVMINNGFGWIESGEYRFDSAGAIKATETIARLLGLFDKDNDQRRNIVALNISQNDIKMISDRLDDAC